MSDETPAPKKSKTPLIIAAAVLGTIGIAAGVYFGFMHKGGGETAKAEAPAPVHTPAQFVELDPPFVVNFEAGSKARFLQIAVQLMTRDPLMVEFLEHNAPIIRNDLLLLFGNKKVEEVSTQDGKEALRIAALDAVRKIVEAEGQKPEALEAVYFTSFVMQ